MIAQLGIVFGTILFALGRFTIPGHALTGWPGLYEAFAHIWIGVLIGAIFWTGHKKSAAIQLIAITNLEIVMFFVNRAMAG